MEADHDSSKEMTGAIKTFRDLNVWKKAIELAVNVYRVPRTSRGRAIWTDYAGASGLDLDFL